jgi:hypothetical protein
MAALLKEFINQEKLDPSIIDVFTQRPFYKTRYTSRSLTNELWRILNTGAKHNLRLDSPHLHCEAILNLPAGAHHIGKPAKAIYKDRAPTAKCLRMDHKSHRTGDLVTQASLAKSPSHESNTRTCPCLNCRGYRSKGCKNPDTCHTTAGKVLADLCSKFCPYKMGPTKRTIRRMDKESMKADAIGKPEDIKIFDQMNVGETDTPKEHRHSGAR